MLEEIIEEILGQSSEPYYPNVQQKLMPPQELFKGHIEHKQVDKFQKIVNTLGETIGYGWIFASIIVGGSVILMFIFKTQIKKRFGQFLKWLSDWVNG